MALNIKFEKNQIENYGKNPKLEKIINRIKNFIGSKFSEYEEVESIVLFGSLA